MLVRVHKFLPDSMLVLVTVKEGSMEGKVHYFADITM
jgi:hypothetical protein